MIDISINDCRSLLLWLSRVGSGERDERSRNFLYPILRNEREGWAPGRVVEGGPTCGFRPLCGRAGPDYRTCRWEGHVFVGISFFLLPGSCWDAQWFQSSTDGPPPPSFAFLSDLPIAAHIGRPLCSRLPAPTFEVALLDHDRGHMSLPPASFCAVSSVQMCRCAPDRRSALRMLAGFARTVAGALQTCFVGSPGMCPGFAAG